VVKQLLVASWLNYLKTKKGKSPYLVAADIYRPAAY
jgi:signal recognition particle GTPase